MTEEDDDKPNIDWEQFRPKPYKRENPNSCDRPLMDYRINITPSESTRQMIDSMGKFPLVDKKPVICSTENCEYAVLTTVDNLTTIHRCEQCSNEFLFSNIKFMQKCYVQGCDSFRHRRSDASQVCEPCLTQSTIIRDFIVDNLLESGLSTNLKLYAEDVIKQSMNNVN